MAADPPDFFLGVGDGDAVGDFAEHGDVVAVVPAGDGLVGADAQALHETAQGGSLVGSFFHDTYKMRGNHDKFMGR